MPMGVFESDKELIGSPKYIPQLAEKICQTFAADGFETSKEITSVGSCDISLYKGGLFKAVLGMKSALKVTISPQNDNIYIKAGVGIFGQQAIPTVITMLVFWPVLLAQIWGMVQQSKLDDLAINIAEEELNRLMQNECTQYAGVKTGEASAEPVVTDAPAPEKEPAPSTTESEAAFRGGAVQPEEFQPELRPKFCPECGEPIIPGGKFCVGCGRKL